MRARPEHERRAGWRAQAPRAARVSEMLAVCAMAGSVLAASHAVIFATAPERIVFDPPEKLVFDPPEKLVFDPPEKLVFDPKVPSKCAKLFTVEHHLALQGMKLEDNGVEQLLQQGLNLDTKQVLRTLDEYKACADGRPTLLRRTYDEADLHVDVTFQEGNGSDKVATDAIEAKSPFEGLSVLFTWVPEEKSYGKFYDVIEGDEEYLPNLTEDLDLFALLPGHEVAAGDEWSIEPALLVDWVAPGGRLPMQFEKKKKDDRFVRTLSLGVGGGLTMVFGGEVKGKVSARYVSREESGTTSLAVIALDVDVQTERDQTGIAQSMLSAGEVLDRISVQRSAVQWKMKADGKARWNLTAKRFESLELAGREEVAYELLLGTPGGGKSRQNMSLSGGIRVTAQAGPAAAKAKVKDKPKSRPESENPPKDEKDKR